MENLKEQSVCMGVIGRKGAESYSDTKFTSNFDGDDYTFDYGIKKYGGEIRTEFDRAFVTPLTDDEFAMLIGYIEGHGYMPVIDEEGSLYRKNIEDDGEEIEEYSVLEYMDYIQEANTELIECADDKTYKIELAQDSTTLSILVKKLR